jgi:hypothetical protein
MDILRSCIPDSPHHLFGMSNKLEFSLSIDNECHVYRVKLQRRVRIFSFRNHVISIFKFKY